MEKLYRDALFHDALAATQAASLLGATPPALRAQLELVLGKIYTAFGDTAKARGHFRAALALDPELELQSETSPKITALFQAERIGRRR